MSTETPFTISIPDDKIAQLKAKLEAATFPDELDEAGWDYGAPLADVKRLVARWRDGFDWKKHEKILNEELPQYTKDIEIEGFGTLNTHYVHKKSEAVDAIPLLFVHGWPGSFIEVRKILPLLTASSPEHPSFHVVAFSIPGYGFSEAPKKKGFAVEQCAELGNKLMLSLGYNEYVTQGGDWGYFITRNIARLYGHKHCQAWHTNMGVGRPPHPVRNPLLFLGLMLSMTPYTNLYTEREKKGLERSQAMAKKGMGFVEIQSTKPQTIGYALADSPVGLLAWIYEKMVAWTDGYPWEDDEILEWISIYWFSRAGPAASLRIHYEVIGQGGVIGNDANPSVPMGVSFFPAELVNVPRSWVRLRGKVIFESENEKGGHFAAHEVPESLVNDVRKMFGKGGPAFGVVKGKTGY